MIYNRTNIISLRLRSSFKLRKLSRQEFFSRLQVIRTIDPITQAAYRAVEDERWRNGDESPHGQPWHVTFHASQFPGDDPMACPRQALYQMMDFPKAEPFKRRNRTVMEAGKAIEVELVRTWHEAEILLSASPEEVVQTGFEIPEAWLTGSVDAVLLPPDWDRPLPIEVKTKYQKDIDAMQLGQKGPDQSHISQLKVQLALVRMDQDDRWPGLQPVSHGFIYYLSRDRPDSTAEFRVDYDPKFFDIGLERLREWRRYFEESYLPTINPSKKHPFGWRWSYPPCAWCDWKKTCQLDHQQGIEDLNESVGVNRARLVRPDYDPESARLRVRARWAQNKDSIQT